jgi:hypothetical protein
MAGLHDVREEWLARVRALPQPPKILPRVNFEVRQEAFVKIASSSALQKKIVSELINVIERWGFDGLVLELTYVCMLCRSALALAGRQRCSSSTRTPIPLICAGVGHRPEPCTREAQQTESLRSPHRRRAARTLPAT